MKLSVGKTLHYDSGPNMTPLVDVVMVILIFLMLAGTFGAASHFLPNSVPYRPGGPGGVTGQPRDASLDLYVASLSGGGFRVRLADETYTDAAALRQALETRRLAHEAAGTPADQVQVVIRPRAATRYEDVIRVSEAAMDARWPHIGFQAARD